MSEQADVPTLFVRGENLPEAWEKAILTVWDRGIEVHTEYDSPEDPPSLDATVTIEVAAPLSEPRIHKNFPAGLMELEVYRQEVVEGIHDHWIDAQGGKWTYTYHQRLFRYRPLTDIENPEAGPQFDPMNQVEYMVEKLADVPHSRRAQAITWIPHADPGTEHPPCLQRIWARLLPDGEGGWRLNMNTHWRSRDLQMAWFMNAFALTDLQRIIAGQLQDRIGQPVACGRYVDVSDSLHIYGSYRTEELEAEVEKMKSSPYTERAWDSSLFEDTFEEARENLRGDPDFYARGDPDRSSG
jgi:thymidylate synthase